MNMCDGFKTAISRLTAGAYKFCPETDQHELTDIDQTVYKWTFGLGLVVALPIRWAAAAVIGLPSLLGRLVITGPNLGERTARRIFSFSNGDLKFNLAYKKMQTAEQSFGRAVNYNWSGVLPGQSAEDVDRYNHKHALEKLDGQIEHLQNFAQGRMYLAMCNHKVEYDDPQPSQEMLDQIACECKSLMISKMSNVWMCLNNEDKSYYLKSTLLMAMRSVYGNHTTEATQPMITTAVARALEKIR